MTQQYLRQLSLVVANPAGAGLELGDLRVSFTVHRGDLETPNTADVTIWNLSDATANKINSPEFTQLALNVGYEDQQLQLIFRGSIKQVRLGREDQKNSYATITAADGDEAYLYSFMALTLASNSTQATGLAGIIQAMARRASGNPTGGSGGQQVSQGYTPQLNPNPRVRGRTFYGLCRDEMRELALNNDCTWSIQDGLVTLVPNTGYIPAAPVLITPSTGLIGVPEQTQNGLEMTVLLNPSIKIGQTVKLDSTVNKYRYPLDRGSIPVNLQLAQSTTKLNADGLYYVMRAEHTGDTRGNPWYTKLTCLAVDASVPLGPLPGSSIFPGNAVPRY
jgi:hypothetical protein